MAKEKEPSADTLALAQAIAKGIVDATNATGPIKQIPLTKYRGKTATNPTGERESRRPQMVRTFYQNGSAIQLWQITDKDVALLNQIRPGFYIGDRVQVVERAGDGKQTLRPLDITYNNQTADQRFENKNEWRNFTELLTRLVAEAQDAAEPALAEA
jgi:hypothetical protein